jgi:hypothetical protein
MLLAGTVRRLYLQHLIATTPKNKLRALLLPLATPDVRKRVQIDINYLLDHPDEIVPYFTSRDADEVLILLGTMLNSEGAQVDLRRITPAQQKQLQSAVNSGELSKWVANKYRNGRVDPDTVSAWVLVDCMQQLGHYCLLLQSSCAAAAMQSPSPHCKMSESHMFVA